MRELNPQLLKYIDDKLAKNGLAQRAIEQKDARALVWICATALVGIQEATGRNDGKMVNLIQDTVGGMDEWPWCMSMVQTCIAYAEAKTGIKSPIAVGEGCIDVWNRTPKAQRVKILPLAGAIAIWGDLLSSGKLKGTGHTEVVLSSDGKVFQAVGGNTSGSLNPKEAVNREGNGVYYTVRSHSSTAKRKLLGFLKPF